MENTTITPVRNNNLEAIKRKEMNRRLLIALLLPFFAAYDKEKKEKRPPCGKTDLTSIFVPVITVTKGRRVFSNNLVKRMDRQEAFEHPNYSKRFQPYWGEE
ncbi:MAG: hypothetical protein KO464_02370 [Candidatus Methanofastidiosum sp.]|nr:hypothetical protein [Methanofastidiosum sp.]